MKIQRLGNNLYVASGTYLNKFYSTSATTHTSAIAQLIAIIRSLTAWNN